MIYSSSFQPGGQDPTGVAYKISYLADTYTANSSKITVTK